MRVKFKVTGVEIPMPDDVIKINSLDVEQEMDLDEITMFMDRYPKVLKKVLDIIQKHI